MNMRKLAGLLCAALILTCLSGCAGDTKEKTVTRTDFKLDTVVTITLYDWTDESTLDLAMDEITRLQNLLSVEKSGSDLDRLAQAAGKEWVAISPETEEVLDMAKEYDTLTDGYFDVTVGPLIDLWDIHDGTGHYPTQEELADTLPLISSDDLQVQDGKAYLARAGMKANLGAIAKGYIADRVKDLLVQQGVKHAILDLGRNILLIGAKTDGSDFRVGIQNPFQEDGEVYGVLTANDESVVTSGVYERYFEYNGVRYHHILDPFTGFPAETGVTSVTILSKDSVDGDALSTSCLLLGADKGMQLVESLPDVEALFILDDGTEQMTDGFAARMES